MSTVVLADCSGPVQRCARIDKEASRLLVRTIVHRTMLHFNTQLFPCIQGLHGGLHGAHRASQWLALCAQLLPCGLHGAHLARPVAGIEHSTPSLRGARVGQKAQQ
eukprot:1140118-Pelagomonas_calceolata.AAC.7